jgi:glutaconyl-CoA/methylmalonyl-CoA decarboxylase subunit gamma
VRYFVTLEPGGPQTEIDVRELPSGALEVRSDGARVDVDLAFVGRALSVRVDGRVVDLTTEGTPPDLGIIASGHRSYVRVESDRMRAALAAATHKPGAGEDVVRSPMPGRIVRVLVAVGDEVEPGQALLVVEAMKMENELRAKRAGRIAEVLVAVGATVEGNAKLLRFS